MLATLALLALIAPVEPPDRTGPPGEDALAAISSRGRDLAGFDAAAWHGSDAVQAANPKDGSVERYIARKTVAGWVVAFGKLDRAGDRFLVAYEATQGKEPDKFEVQGFDPPKPDSGFYRSAAKAIDSAMKEFSEHFDGKKRPYNVAVLPADEGRFWVYLVPAPTRPGVWPLGGDFRYLVSPDGSKILGTRQLHKSVFEKGPPPKGADGQLAMGMHTHVLADVPEDTDVFHVLTRKPAMPELIVTGRFVFQVAPDGALMYLGEADKLMKK